MYIMFIQLKDRLLIMRRTCFFYIFLLILTPALLKTICEELVIQIKTSTKKLSEKSVVF